MTKTTIEMKNGSPIFCVNGERIAENAYISYFGEKARYDDFSEAGYKLYSVPLYFATRSITEINDIPPFDDGIFEDRNAPDYSIIDRAFMRVLEYCPDAYIFPRVNMALPMWWEQENPDELCDYGNLGQHRRRHCFSSDKWAEETKRLLGLFIDHIESAPYRDRICGYQLAGGNTEEWLAFDFRGSIGKRSREKFAEYREKTGVEDSEEEYYAFLSLINSMRIVEFSEFAKKRCNNRVVIGAFYGYTFECPSRTTAHHGLEYMLNSDAVDFLCSPISYTGGRALGEDHPCMLPLESLKRHGKLYFIENDARTHLSGPLFDVKHFDNIHYKPRSREHSIQTLPMYFARALIYDHALWWFDMGGGWHHYPEYMKLMKKFLEIKKESMKLDMQPRCEVAVLVDERTFATLNDEQNKEKAVPVSSYFRKTLGFMGTPFAALLASDYELVKNDYKAFILLEPRVTPRSAAIAACEKNLIRVTPENYSTLTPSALREALSSFGVHIYSDRDAVIYANDSYLFLHAPELGKYEIKLKVGERLEQILGDEVDLSEHTLPEKTSYLFRIVKDS